MILYAGMLLVLPSNSYAQSSIPPILVSSNVDCWYYGGEPTGVYRHFQGVFLVQCVLEEWPPYLYPTAVTFDTNVPDDDGILPDGSMSYSRAVCEADQVQNTITSYAINSGVDFSGFGYVLGPPTIAGYGNETQTEMYLNGNLTNFSNLEAALIANGFEYAGFDPLHGDYRQSYRQHTTDGQWSLQVSYDDYGNIQVDIDPHNPLQDLSGHLWDVFINALVGRDTNYHTAAQVLGLSDQPC